MYQFKVDEFILAIFYAIANNTVKVSLERGEHPNSNRRTSLYSAAAAMMLESKEGNNFSDSFKCSTIYEYNYELPYHHMNESSLPICKMWISKLPKNVPQC